MHRPRHDEGGWHALRRHDALQVAHCDTHVQSTPPTPGRRSPRRHASSTGRGEAHAVAASSLVLSSPVSLPVIGRSLRRCAANLAVGAPQVVWPASRPQPQPRPSRATGERAVAARESPRSQSTVSACFEISGCAARPHVRAEKETQTYAQTHNGLLQNSMQSVYNYLVMSPRKRRKHMKRTQDERLEGASFTPRREKRGQLSY